MPQNTTVTLEPATYTKLDFVGLRAWVMGVSVTKIESLYYSEDSPQVVYGLEKHFKKMLDDLVTRAMVANPHIADSLRKAHSGGRLTEGALKVIYEISQQKTTKDPLASDPVSQWFRPTITKILMSEGCSTLLSLVKLIEHRGPSWHRTLPRLGKLKARAVENWLNSRESTQIDPQTQLVVLDQSPKSELFSRPLPLELISGVPSNLNGASGRNRAKDFCFIQANDDLQAIHDYLLRFRDQPLTFKTYRKELERLLLWCVLVRKTALSSMLVHDCEAYKDFLKTPLPSFVGPREKRFSPKWKPFAEPLSEKSQKFAVQIIRTAFEWLVKMRYLGGNPWVGVKDPKTDIQILPMQIDKALSSSLWEKTVLILHEKAQLSPQWRVARAAIMLMGETGLRRSEAAGALRGNMRASQHADLYILRVLGKRSKWRDVPVSKSTYLALFAHWEDLENLEAGDSPPLLHPRKRLKTKTAQDKTTPGYNPGALGTLVVNSLKQLAQDERFTPVEVIKLKEASAHDLRHTFGTSMVANGLPTDVLQKILGHVSLSTTSIYVQTEEKRMAIESEKAFALKDSNVS
jgi:site-specific recombinase XerD